MVDDVFTPRLLAIALKALLSSGATLDWLSSATRHWEVTHTRQRRAQSVFFSWRKRREFWSASLLGAWLHATTHYKSRRAAD